MARAVLESTQSSQSGKTFCEWDYVNPLSYFIISPIFKEALFIQMKNKISPVLLWEEKIPCSRQVYCEFGETK